MGATRRWAARAAALLAPPLAACAAFAPRADAQTMTVSGNPSRLTVSTAAFAGAAPTSVTAVNTTTYTVGTNLTANRKITAQLAQAMPAGLTLETQLQAQSGGTSLGWVTLATTARDVVTALPTNLGGTAQGISYRLSATVGAGTVASTTRVVTFTIVAGP